MGWWIALWILLGLTGVIAILIVLPVGIRVRYLDGDLKMWYTIGPVRLLRYPETETEKEKRKNSKITVRTVLNDSISANRKFDSLLGDFLAELKTLLELFWALRPKLRLKRLVVKLVLGGDDPCSVAMQYGGAWAAVGMIFPVLDGAFTIKKHDISVDCDLSAGSQTRLVAKLDLTIGLGRLLARLVRYIMKTMPDDMERR